MKNNQKKRRDNRSRQNHFCHDGQRKPMAAVMTIEKVQEITIPRDEYDELMYCSVLLDTVERLYKATDKYAVYDLLENLFDDADKLKKEDK